MEPKQAMDAADWWINKVATWGLAFVFLACVLLLILWVAITFVGLARKFLPMWFESSIQSHNRVAKAVEDLTDSIDCIHQKTHAVHEGMRGIVKAGTSYLRTNKTRLGVASDVFIHMQNAQEALSRDFKNKNHHHRAEDSEIVEDQGDKKADDRPTDQPAGNEATKQQP
jgi:hypothetical protein